MYQASKPRSSPDQMAQVENAHDTQDLKNPVAPREALCRPWIACPTTASSP
jgi:hypothetical protein